MKIYSFEGENYVKSGEKERAPKEGEVFFSTKRSRPIRAWHDYTMAKKEILILLPSCPSCSSPDVDIIRYEGRNVCWFKSYCLNCAHAGAPESTVREAAQSFEASEELEDEEAEESKEEPRLRISPEEREALMGSIEKWTEILYKGQEDERADNCPLCQLHSEDCTACIVCRTTGKSGCRGIGYHQWTDHQMGRHRKPMGSSYRGRIIYCSTCRSLAQEVHEGLRNILANTLVKAKSKFEPFTLQVNTEEEAKELWHRLNISLYVLRTICEEEFVQLPGKRNLAGIWRETHKILEARGIAKEIPSL